MKLTFAEPADVTNLWGKPSFDANGLSCFGLAQGWPSGAIPMAVVREGRWGG